MSLIQQALEKTNHVKGTRTTTSVPASKPWDRDPMGAALEQELIRVQQSYATRRSLYWKIVLGVLLLGCAAGLFYVIGIRGTRPGGIKALPIPVAIPVSGMSPSPLKIYSGNIFRLTGIMDLGHKTMAVINGNIVGVGDSLAGKAVVKAIGNGEVRLDIQGQEIKLTL